MTSRPAQRFAVWSRRAAALGLLCWSGRFAWVATTWASDQYASSSEGAEDRKRPTSARRPPADEPADAAAVARDLAEQGKGGDGRPLAPGTTTDTSAAAPNAPKAPPNASLPKPKQRTLLVDLGPARSEVFVSGVLVGHTPYAGSWTCRDGDVLVIHVLPKGRGAPIESRAFCENSIRAVAGRTLAQDEVANLLADSGVPPSVKEALRR